MNASVLDLRYKTSDILNALDHQEQVTILYHGKPKATIIPLETFSSVRVCEHDFFGMYATETESVENVMERLRGGRHDL